MKASDFHNLYGDVVSLDVFAELQELDLTAVQDVRFGDSYVGKKGVYRYKTPPAYWNIPDLHTDSPVRIESNQGSFFLPHRDLRREDTNDWIRLNCFLNNTDPEQCTYVIDGVIQHFEERRWYIVNPRKTHYSFTFADNTVHYVVDIRLADEEVYKWVHQSIQHHGDKALTREGTK